MQRATGRSRAHRTRKIATNLSALEMALREKQREAWLTENQDAIRAYNEQVERRGVFSDGRRRF